MIQDIYPKVFKNQYSLCSEPKKDDFVIAFSKDQVLISSEEGTQIHFPTVELLGTAYQYTYLFAIDEHKFFLATLDPSEDVVIPGFTFTEIQQIRELQNIPNDQMLALYTGKHLHDWYRDTRFCGRCGHKTEPHTSERAMKCPSCGYTAYPRVMPAVIVGILHDGKILLTKYRVGYRHFALVAGFAEIGETIEETVAREVMEEVGLHVKNIRYYKSQPWGLANDLLFGFFCEVDGDAAIRMDADELKYAEWTAPQDVELQPNNYSLTNEMMKLFKDGDIPSHSTYAI